jgi:hypothetical protein
MCGDNYSDKVPSIHVNFGQDQTFANLKAVNKNRINSSTADSVWHQSSNTGDHTDWTVASGGTELDVTVPGGHYSRVTLRSADGTIDPKKTYLLSFEYTTGPANLGIQDDHGYMTAVDGSVSPTGLSSGNFYSFVFHGSSIIRITGFNGSTYSLDNVIVSEIDECYTDDSGKGKFHYQPPTGFLALCEDNLPTPAIADPGKHFKSVLYTGKGSTGTDGSQSIRKVGFQPDLVWVKKRGTAGDHKLIDSVRGVALVLETNTTDEEGNENNNFTGFNSDGFDLGANNAGAWNEDGYGYVAWCWKAGGAAVSNTDGTLASQVSVNQDAGFSIVSYTANQTSGATVGHGLGKTPKMVIVKQRTGNTNNWPVYHEGAGNTKALYLDLTNNQGGDFTGAWNNTSPTSSVFSLGNSVETNRSSSPYIAYCWTEIEGFSKFGSYTGNGVVDGPFVYCGFKPAFIMFKNASAAGNWVMSDSSRDSSNPVFGYQVADGSAIEERGTALFDSLSNGFKIRNAWTSFNGNTNNIIFMAFAESPFQTANAK